VIFIKAPITTEDVIEEEEDEEDQDKPIDKIEDPSYKIIRSERYFRKYSAGSHQL